MQKQNNLFLLEKTYFSEGLKFDVKKNVSLKSIIASYIIERSLNIHLSELYDLKTRMDVSIINESYELAALARDEIKELKRDGVSVYPV